MPIIARNHRKVELGKFLYKYDFHIFCTMVYAACCMVMSQFADGVVAMLISALILWMILIIPLAFIVGVAVSITMEIFELIRETTTAKRSGN